jgi:hypothetical protein
MLALLVRQSAVVPAERPGEENFRAEDAAARGRLYDHYRSRMRQLQLLALHPVVMDLTRSVGVIPPIAETQAQEGTMDAANIVLNPRWDLMLVVVVRGW